jgi:hypothetical protein
VADELEPVTQEFVAALSDYLEPIEDAADETEGFADVVEQATENLSGLRDTSAEAGETLADLSAGADDADASLGGMAGSADDATASTETFAESVARMRDEVYEAYPGIDEATAALLAEAGAAQGVANEEYAGSLGAAQFEANGLYATLGSIKDILGAAGLGESLTVTSVGLSQFLIETEEEAENAATAVTGLQTGADLLDDSMLKVANSTRDFWEAVNALNPELGFSNNIFKDAKAALRDLGATEYEAAAGATALAKAQSELDNVAGAGGGGLSGLIMKMFGGGASDVGSEDSFLPPGFDLGGIWSVTKLAALGTAVVALSTEAGALVTGVSAAITGIVPAVALAIPAVESLAHAFDDNGKQLAKLPAGEREAILGIRGLKDEYMSMAKAFEPDVFGVLDRGVNVAKELLPTFKPLADQAAGGIDNLLGQLEKFFKEPWDTKHIATGVLAEHNPLQQALAPPTGFEKWLKEIGPDIAPAEKAIGQFIGTVVGDWGKFMTEFSPKDIQNAFHVLDVAVNVWEGTWSLVIGEAMHFWDENVQVFNAGVHVVEDTLHVLEDVGRETIHGFEVAVDDGMAAAKGLITGAAHDIESMWDLVPAQFRTIGVHLVEGLIGGVKSMIGDLMGTIGSMASGALGAAEHFLGIGSPSTITRQHGLWLMEGYAEGIKEGTPMLDASLKSALGGLPGLFPGSSGGAGGTGRMNVTVPLQVILGAGAGSLQNDPQFLQFIQREMQEAVLRYGLQNPTNGLTRITPGVRTA